MYHKTQKIKSTQTKDRKLSRKTMYDFVMYLRELFKRNQLIGFRMTLINYQNNVTFVEIYVTI